MQTNVTLSKTTHPLLGIWDLYYYHLPQDKSWGLNSYQIDIIRH